MIEKVILNYLSSELTNIPVYMEHPENTEPPYIVLEKTGSNKKDFIKSAKIAVQSYGNTLFEAATLNETVKEKMDALISVQSVSASDLDTDYNFTDTRAKEYRYQAIYDITYY